MKITKTAAFAALPLAASGKVISLVGNDWTLSNPNLNISIPAHLPSQAHLDLLEQQVIGDTYHNLNDFNLRWIAWSNWTYTSAPISGLSSNASSTWLQFDGLDTFTSIKFCGKHMASTNNQFRQYWFDVSDILTSCKEQDRVLSINFGSAPTIANEIANEPDAETWPYGVQQIYEFFNRWFIRKEQSDFGWDWGPAFAPAGPWKPAYVIQLEENQVHVRNSIVDIYRQGQVNNLIPDQTQPWIVNASMDYFGELPDDAELMYTLYGLDGKTLKHGSLENLNSTDATVTGMTMIPNGTVELWWPSQLGPQNLYNMTISLQASNRTLASVHKRVGFRTIVLNEDPISEEQLAQGIAPGNNWHFEINGHEFYAKGSNFIPPDAFWPRVTPERINSLFESVIEGNQNMLRVWSSGAYSPDFMFDLADEKGILLWTEFEFGDALYPVNDEFLDNVRQEAEYQVRRCNHHPSLALWAGGNELENLELSLLNESAPEQFNRYVAEYEKLFLTTLFPAVFENTRSISYSPSSTSNGWISLNFTDAPYLQERYFNLTPGSIYGETDFYNYDPAVLYNDSAYPVGRFSNEFGYHSMPSIQSWRQQISEEYLSFNSSVVTLRDHHSPPGGLNTSNYANSSQGQAQMTEAVQLWYPVPNKTDPIANFSAWCWATQIFQADLYVSEIEFYRRGSGLPERQLGSLYWQLEDIWVAPTWASVEYDGRWKVLHYAARRAYENVIVAPYYNVTTGNLSVWVTSDLWSPASGSVSFDWYDWAGNALNVSNAPSTVNFTIGAINSTQVMQTNTSVALRDPTNAVLRMRIEADGERPNAAPGVRTHFAHENWFHASPLNTAQLQDPGLELTHSNQTGAFSVRATKGVAAWAWLDYPGSAVVTFEDNGFYLAKGEQREVRYRVKSDNTDGAWVDGVTVQSLWNQTLSE